MHRYNNGSLDPTTMIIVETAFDEAWITLRTNGHDNIRPEELARCILHLAMEESAIRWSCMTGPFWR